MTTGSSAQTRPLPKQPAVVPMARTRPQVGAAPTRVMQPMTAVFSSAETDDEFQMNLADLPRLSADLHVDGFAPSLASRVLDLFDRLRRR